MESKVSQKLFKLNINLFGNPSDPVDAPVVLEPVEAGKKDVVAKSSKTGEGGIRPAADILDFTYPPESPFYQTKKQSRK